MDRLISTLILAGSLTAGTFQEPHDLYTLTYPANWEVRVLQQEGSQVFLLQRTPAYDATLLMFPFWGNERGDATLSRVEQDMQQTFPTARFTFLPPPNGATLFMQTVGSPFRAQARQAIPAWWQGDTVVRGEPISLSVETCSSCMTPAAQKF